jgi:hypothetical protein
MRLSFPAGIYVADFRNKSGVYYRSPDKVTAMKDNENRARNGGLYVPSESDPDQRQGAWFDQQESPSKDTHVELAAPTRTYRFDEAVPFQMQSH